MIALGGKLLGPVRRHGHLPGCAGLDRARCPLLRVLFDRARCFLWAADGWALFDTMVISVSVILLFFDSGSADGQGGNSWVKQLRVLRAFRLLRLLGKMGDLKKIVAAVAMSLLPTFQALVSPWLYVVPHSSLIGDSSLELMGL